MTISLEKIKNTIFATMLTLSLAWMFIALSFQVYCVVLEFTDQQEKLSEISHEMTIRLDGRFSDNPKNMFYKGK
jgi:hypothetical protein